MKVPKPLAKLAQFVQSHTAKANTPDVPTQWKTALKNAPASGKVIYVGKKGTPIVRDAHAKAPKSRNRDKTADMFFMDHAQRMIDNNPPGTLTHMKGQQMRDMIARINRETIQAGAQPLEGRSVDWDLKHVAEHMF